MSGGTVQDVEVIATEQIERQATVRLCRTSLEALGGAPAGSKVAAWHAWWDANSARLLRSRAERYASPTGI